MYISDEVKTVDLSNFKVEEISATDKFILVKARKECPVYFAFYSHFIVCSGDYGEWVFDCTWQTIKNAIPGNADYLFGKLSRNIDAYDFSSALAVEQLEDKIRSIVTDYNYELTEEQKEELEDAYYEFKSALEDTDKYRYISVMDENIDKLEEIFNRQFDGEERGSFYDMGQQIKRWIIVNIAMLFKLRDDKVLDAYFIK